MAVNVRFPAPPTLATDTGSNAAAKKVYGRKALDFVPPTLRYNQYRKLYESPSEFPAVENDPLFAPFMVAPRPEFGDPFGCICTRMMRLATNKQKSPVMQVTYMPNANRALTGAKSGEFTLWNCQTLSFETVLQAHDNPIRSMRWSADNLWLLSADELGYIKYWQSNMMNVKAFQAHTDAVCALSFSPLSSKFASGSDDGSLAVWDFESTREVSRWKSVGADVKCCAWHPKTSLIVSGMRDMQQPMRMFDTRSTELIGALYYHKAGVTDLRWNPFNSNWLLSSSHDGLVKLMDIRTMKILQTFRGHKRDVTTISWHPVYENLFASGGYDGSLLYWVYGFDKEIARLDNAHEQAVWSAEWHPIGHMVITCSNDTTTRFWTRLRPGEYDANTIRAGGAAAIAAATVVSTAAAADAEVAGTDDEGFDTEPNAYGLAAAQWQWPEQNRQQQNRSSNATARERNANNFDSNSNAPYMFPEFVPRQTGPQQHHFMQQHPRRMPSPVVGGRGASNLHLSSVLARFSSFSSERGGSFPSKFLTRGSATRQQHHQPQGGVRPAPAHMNWSRLQLLDRPPDEIHQRSHPDSNYPDFNSDFPPPSHHREFAQPPPHRFPPPSAFGRRGNEDTEEGDGESPLKRRAVDDAERTDSGQSAGSDAGKFLLPDPTNANQPGYSRNADANSTQTIKYEERDFPPPFAEQQDMPQFRDSYTRREYAGGGSGEEHDDYPSEEAGFPQFDEDYHSREQQSSYRGGGRGMRPFSRGDGNRGFTGDRRGGDRSGGRPYYMPRGGRRSYRDAE